jgi:hypothetical protein
MHGLYDLSRVVDKLDSCLGLLAQSLMLISLFAEVAILPFALLGLGSTSTACNSRLLSPHSGSSKYSHLDLVGDYLLWGGRCKNRYDACCVSDRNIYLHIVPDSYLQESALSTCSLLLAIPPLLAKVKGDISVLDHMSNPVSFIPREENGSLLDLSSHCQTKQCQKVDQ